MKGIEVILFCVERPVNTSSKITERPEELQPQTNAPDDSEVLFKSASCIFHLYRVSC